MLSVILILILPVYFIIIGLRVRGCQPEERTNKITKPLSALISFSPLIGIVVFAVLFSFVLKGRIAERATHAFLVFAVWIYAARFYQYMLAYYKKKKILAGSAVGMTFSVALAMLLTPLDRYVDLIYSFTDWYIAFLGCGLFIIFYAVTFIVQKGVKQEK